LTRWSTEIPAKTTQSGLGTASLLIALVALATAWSVLGGISFGAVAVAMGFAGCGRVKRGEASNHGVTVTRIVLGIVSIMVGLIFIAAWAAIVIAAIRNHDYTTASNGAGRTSDHNRLRMASQPLSGVAAAA
jgi:hypothetical protein